MDDGEFDGDVEGDLVEFEGEGDGGVGLVDDVWVREGGLVLM